MSLKGFKAIFQVTAHLKQKVSGFTSLLFFLSKFSFRNIHDLQDSRERGYLLESSLLHRHLDINPAITAESSSLHIASSRISGRKSEILFLLKGDIYFDITNRSTITFKGSWQEVSYVFAKFSYLPSSLILLH